MRINTSDEVRAYVRSHGGVLYVNAIVAGAARGR